MTTCNKKLNNRKGSVLAYILVIMSVVSIILLSIIQFIVSQVKYSSYNSYRGEAFQIAESGVYFYRWYLAHNTEGKTAVQIDNFWKSSPLGVGDIYEAEYDDPEGGAVGKYQLEVTPPSKGSTVVEVKSTAWTYKYPEAKRIIKVRYRKPSWSEYAVLGDDYTRFGSGTNVYGKIFANNGVHFDGVIHNIVSSAVNSYYDSDSDVRATKPGVWTSWTDEYNTDMSSDVFLSGKKYPIATKDFSSVYADFNIMKAEAVRTGNYYDDSGDGRYIILKGNTYDIRKVNGHSSNNNAPKFLDHDEWSLNNPIPEDGVIFVEDNIWLEGTLGTAETGQRLTVVAANLKTGNQPSVFIGNDINYYNNQHDGNNILGIVAEDNIEIIKDSQNILNIDGALLAQKGRVGREYYTVGCWCGNSSCEDHKDTITVNGAIASGERYGFSWLDSCSRNTGYTNRNIYFDNNLLYYPPPYFPTGSQYLLDLWEEL